MPCRDGFARDHMVQEDIDRYQCRLDEVTQHLCYMCGQATEDGVIDGLTKDNPRLQKWWEDHQQSDEIRVSLEMMNSYFRHDTPENMAQEFIEKAEKVHKVSDFHKKWFNELAERVFRES